MIITKVEKKMCFSCMKEHEVKYVKIQENSIFKKEEVVFDAEYEYCENTDDFLENEEQIKMNDLSLKDAYRKKKGLLTSSQIKTIREKYDISQKQFSEVLGWGAATIIRYENHQVQDRAHDDILRKIDKDPKWFIEMLKRSKEEVEHKYYMKYYNNALKLLNIKDNPYFLGIIKAVNYSEVTSFRGFESEVYTSKDYCTQEKRTENKFDLKVPIHLMSVQAY